MKEEKSLDLTQLIEEKMLFVGIDRSLDGDVTMIAWYCSVCAKPATVILVKVESQFERSIQINGVFVQGRLRNTGEVELLPFCSEHDSPSQTAYVLRCELTEKTKKLIEAKFPVDQVNSTREVTIE